MTDEEEPRDEADDDSPRGGIPVRDETKKFRDDELETRRESPVAPDKKEE